MPSKTECAVDGCERASVTHQMCRMHYLRLRRSGTTDPPIPRNAYPCAVDGCDKAARSRGWCDTHYTRWKVTGDPTKVLKVKSPTRQPCIICGNPVAARQMCEQHYRQWRKTGDPIAPPKVITYDAVHDRMRRRNGPATRHLCVQCFAPAKEWAYTHDDPDVRTENLKRGGTVRFSADLDRYVPMCIPCHRDMDRHTQHPKG